jgi:DNA polymerase-3 subunit epsilon/ATP-dependent DNA helicase DinG
VIPPHDEVWVSLDLETTGLSPDADDIIEVGAVKFQGRREIGTFQTFVNPHRRLSDFIKRYTGIQQADVDAAPPFSAVSPKLAAFVGTAPVVGHNVGFDLGFLAAKGLRLHNSRSDTWDMAYVLLPQAPEYSLSKVSAQLKVAHPRPHRALEDARVAKDLFLKLSEEFEHLDVFALAEMERLASRSSWVLDYLLRRMMAQRLAAARTKLREPDAQVEGGAVAGFDVRELKRRVPYTRPLRPDKSDATLDADFVASLFADDGPLAKAMPGFEHRPQQVAMARAVAQTVDSGGRLIVEAGTGVGKSLSYLLPSVLYALAAGKRVVVSTDTINLQEQLLKKDVPLLVKALKGVPGVAVDDLRFAQLKGRANYLCLKRFTHMRGGELVTDNEARLLAKLLVWLRSTSTGDKSELNMSDRGSSAVWTRVSAQGARDCDGVGGFCFLRAARDRAGGAHLLIVNHALLMADLTAAGALLPEYDMLIVDEAHNLEEEATRHLGFEVSQVTIEDHLQSIAGDGGLMRSAVAAFRTSKAAATRAQAVQELAAGVAAELPRLREALAAMFRSVAIGVAPEASGNGQDQRVTASTRSRKEWAQAEVVWENADVLLADVGKQVDKLEKALEGLEAAGVADYEGLLLEVATASETNTELRQHLAQFVSKPEKDGVYWVSNSPRGDSMTLHMAPLNVGEHLEKRLYAEKRSVVLTSATLAANGAFGHIRERTGFNDAEELLLGSPFDYPSAALLCVPKDVPEPNAWAYQGALEQAIMDAATAAGGRTMALFTSYASLQATASAVRANLEARGLTVLAQGIDGSPHQIVRSYLGNPDSAILGTASFWEGVDLSAESLKVLILAKLPFNVPTEPVFAARSELFEDSFNQYAVPQAILRLRQGFGRLIRSKSDKGVVIIMDSRVLSKRYGKAFLNSLPPSTFRACQLSELPKLIKGWAGR